jgi:hypothetical protein
MISLAVLARSVISAKDHGFDENSSVARSTRK